MKHTYTCECCHQTYTKGWSDAQRDAEAATLWTPEELGDDPATVCDDCFTKMTTITPIAAWKSRKADRKGK